MPVLSSPQVPRRGLTPSYCNPLSMGGSPGTWWMSFTSLKRPAYFSLMSPCRTAPKPTLRDSDSGSRTTTVKMHVFCLTSTDGCMLAFPLLCHGERLPERHTGSVCPSRSACLPFDHPQGRASVLWLCHLCCSWLINSPFSLPLFRFGWDVFPSTPRLAQNSLRSSEQFWTQDRLPVLPGLQMWATGLRHFVLLCSVLFLIIHRHR